MSKKNKIVDINTNKIKKKQCITKYTKKYLDSIDETTKIHPIKQYIRIKKLLDHFGTHYGYLD